MQTQNQKITPINTVQKLEDHVKTLKHLCNDHGRLNYTELHILVNHIHSLLADVETIVINHFPYTKT